MKTKKIISFAIVSIFSLSAIFLAGNVLAQTTAIGDVEIPDVGLPDPSPTDGNYFLPIFLGLFNWLLILFFIAALIAFVVTGLMYLFALGNSRSELAERAKNYFLYAIIAIAVTGSGLIIVNFVDDLLSATL